MAFKTEQEAFWAGEESHKAAARPGTLPQSEYFAHTGWFHSGPAFVDAGPHAGVGNGDDNVCSRG